MELEQVQQLGFQKVRLMELQKVQMPGLQMSQLLVAQKKVQQLESKLVQ